MDRFRMLLKRLGDKDRDFLMFMAQKMAHPVGRRAKS